MRLGVDFSQWGGALAASTVECWKQNGVTHAVVQYSERMPQHLDVLHRVGSIEVEGYVYLYWGRSPWGQTPAERTQLAINMSKGRISFLWLDAEDTTNRFQASQLWECVEVCKRNGVPCGIYTGRWCWVGHYGNPTEFSGLPLWDALYTGEGSPPRMDRRPQSFDGWKPYGGWQAPAIWQWHNTTTFCGHSVDLNVLPDGSKPEPQPKGDDEDMFVRWGGLAHPEVFRGMEVENREQEVWGRADWHLPPEAKSVEVVLYLRDGAAMEVLDGNKAKAGFALPGTVTRCRVILDGDGHGRFYLRPYPFEAKAVIDQIECMGFYT